MPSLLDDVNELLKQNKGDIGRLNYIKETLESNKILYLSDRKYLTDLGKQYLKEDASDNTQKRITQYNKSNDELYSKNKNPNFIDDVLSFNHQKNTYIEDELPNRSTIPILPKDIVEPTLPRDKKGGRSLSGYGVLLVFVGVLGYFVPISEFGSVVDLDNLCNSGFGQLGQAFVEDARKACQTFGYLAKLVYLFLGLGGLLIIVGYVKKR